MDIEREIKDLEKISLNKSRNIDEREAAAIKLMRLHAKYNTKRHRKNNAHNTKRNRKNNAHNNTKHSKNTKHNKNSKHNKNTKRSRKWNVPNTDSYKAQRGLY
jgi:hypothetical protein